MDLSDAALRERAQEECSHAHRSSISCGFCYVQGNRYIALRDAARAEQREARMLYNEAVTILLECAHGDEQTCGFKDRALERLARLAAIRAQGGEK